MDTYLYVRILYLEEVTPCPRRAGEPRRVRVKRKARKNNVGREEGVYLVLRVCRACNHRGTAKRPSTPSHSASRHSIFFSLRRSVRLPCPLLPLPPVPGAPLFPGPSRPFALRAIVVPLFLFSPVSLPFRRVTLTRPFYNHYRLSQLDRGRAASLPFRFHSFGRSSFPRSPSFSSFVHVYPTQLSPEIPFISITDDR